MGATSGAISTTALAGTGVGANVSRRGDAPPMTTVGGGGGPAPGSSELSTAQSLELSPGGHLHMVSSEEEKTTVSSRDTRPPSLEPSLASGAGVSEGGVGATMVVSKSESSDEKKLNFLASFASAALSDMNDAAKDKEQQQKQQLEATKEGEKGDEESSALKQQPKSSEEGDAQQQQGHKRRNSADGASLPHKKRYMAEQRGMQQTGSYEQPHHHQQGPPQAYHYDQYRRHPSYEERGMASYNQHPHHGGYQHHQPHQWQPAPHHSNDPRSQGPPPPAIRPQFSRYQPHHHGPPPQPKQQQPPLPASVTSNKDKATDHQDQPPPLDPRPNVAAALAEAALRKNKLPKGLTFRKVCSHCGRQRAEHGEFGFGNKCPFTDCGRCGASAQCHQHASKKTVMGVMCTLTEAEGAIPGASEKYDLMLADLAARAEIRAGLARQELAHQQAQQQMMQQQQQQQQNAM